MTKRIISVVLAIVIFCGTISLIAPQTVVSASSEMTTSNDGLEYLKREEGFGKYPYWDYKQYTVGYGTRCPDDKLEEWTKNGITREEAEQLLRDFLVDIERAINKDLIEKYNLELTQNQFDALVCFSYNVGWSWIYKPSTNMHKAIINGETQSDVVRALSLYSKAGGELIPALAKRRMRDANMYFYGDYKTYKPTTFGYVYYDTNGGTLDYYIQGFDINEEPTPVKDPVWEGHVFMGWYTSKVGGVKVEKLTKDLTTWTLYAHWDKEEGLPIEPIEPVTITVTGTSVNLREGPGTNFPIIGQAVTGDTFVITETNSGTGYEWGKFDSGWICLKYTNYDDVIANKDKVETEPETPDDTTTTLPEVTDPTPDNDQNRPNDDTTTPEHTHVYKETDILQSTCTIEGSKTLTCACGEFYVEKIDLVPHDYKENVIPPTCTSNGYSKHTCVNCGHEYVDTKVDCYGHSYNTEVTDPTCTSGGYTTYTCSVCGDSHIANQIDAIGHDWNAATCTSPKTCKVCGAIDGSVLEHDYSAKTTAPTCTDDGYTTYTCSLCGDHYVGDKILAIGHSYKAVVMAPTCKDKGYTQNSCELCGHSYNSNETNQLSHSWGDWSVIKKPSFTETGLDEKVCKLCGEQETRITEKLQPLKGTVKVNTYLRVRNGPGTNYKSVGTLSNGDKVSVTEQKTVGNMTWGKIDQGWISLTYVVFDSTTENKPNVEQPNQPQAPDNNNASQPSPNPENKPTETPTTPSTKLNGIVKVDSRLRIRSGPGTSYAIAGYLFNGDNVTITEQKKVNGVTWGKIDGGWISMEYVKVVESKPSSTKTITASCLRIRKGPGINTTTVGYLYLGTKVEVFETKTVDGITWGRIDRGWISMNYAK